MDFLHANRFELRCELRQLMLCEWKGNEFGGPLGSSRSLGKFFDVVY